MNRTQRLITAVTSSLLLTGPIQPTAASAPQAPKAAQEDTCSKSDPEVTKAADSIHDWLKGTDRNSAKSQTDIARQFPAYSSTLIANAMKELWCRGDVRITGDGTEASPYRYFDRASSEG